MGGEVAGPEHRHFDDAQARERSRSFGGHGPQATGRVTSAYYVAAGLQQSAAGCRRCRSCRARSRRRGRCRRESASATSAGPANDAGGGRHASMFAVTTCRRVTDSSAESTASRRLPLASPSIRTSSSISSRNRSISRRASRSRRHAELALVDRRGRGLHQFLVDLGLITLLGVLRGSVGNGSWLGTSSACSEWSASRTPSSALSAKNLGFLRRRAQRGAVRRTTNHHSGGGKSRSGGVRGAQGGARTRSTTQRPTPMNPRMIPARARPSPPWRPRESRIWVRAMKPENDRDERADPAGDPAHGAQDERRRSPRPLVEPGT